MNKTWTNACIARWDSLTKRNVSQKKLRVLFITINEMYVKIVESWVNYYKYMIIILLITLQYQVVFSYWLLIAC